MGTTTRFHRAASTGNVLPLKEATRWDVNAPDENLLTPVLLAAANGQTDALTVLLKRGADLSRTDRSGSTALHLAAAAGHRQCVECLLSVNVNVFELNTAGRTALDMAKLHRQVEVAERLEQYQWQLANTNPARADQLRKRAAKQYEKLKQRYGTVIALNLGESFRALEEHTALEESV
uniref:Ankyrin_rpt-contain_dom domain-containing protein n=1 Tax=Anopheles gambiae TaxID=7165 RepID=A0A0E4G9L1_ANOGA